MAETYYIPDDEPIPATIVADETVIVKSAGTATDYTIEGGTMKVNGVAVTTTVNSGKMYVYGTAEDTTLNGGTVYLKPTANTAPTFIGATVNGGTLTMSGGVADGVLLTGGQFLVSDGEVNGTVLDSGSVKVNGGSADETVINGGKMILTGGTVNDTEVNAGAFHVSGGIANDTVINGGVVTVFDGGVLAGAEVYFGGKLNVSGGAATGIVENGGYVEGVAQNDFVVNSFSDVDVTSGSATIHAATTAENLSVGAIGHVYLMGGALTGTLRFTGGDITITEDSTLIFDTTTLQPNSGYLYDDISDNRFKVNAGVNVGFTIMVSDGFQQSGVYALAKNAVSKTIGTGDNTKLLTPIFDGDTDFLLYNDSPIGFDSYAIKLGETLEKDDMEAVYTLSTNTYGTLILTVAAGESAVLNTAGASTFRNLGLPIGGDEPVLVGNTTGLYSLTIKKGSYASIVNCGDRLTVADGIITHSKSLVTTVQGGSFQRSIAGGMMKEADGSIVQNGNINLTITAGTFGANSYVFGGNVASTKSLAQAPDKDVITGDVSVTLDASSNALTFQKSIYAGSYGTGTINGDVGITLTGSNQVTIAGDLWGACSGDKYSAGKPGRDRALVTNISGDRTLTFQGFNSTLAVGNVGGFKQLICEDSTVVIENKKTKNVAFGDVDYWEFSYGSSITGDFGNNFYGDAIILGDDDDTLSGTWTVMESGYTGHNFEAFNKFSYVEIFGEAATFANGCWTSDNYQLAIVDGTQMQVSALSIA